MHLPINNTRINILCNAILDYCLNSYIEFCNHLALNHKIPKAKYNSVQLQ